MVRFIISYTYTFKAISNNEYTRLRFAVPPSGGVTPPEGETTNWPGYIPFLEIT
ncbi:hypothetical protein QUF80_24480 [Desulfococcaceae bacterium HSG8]|nr:hypothetical protein [Desulfococcaceae bacterium HSG8]